MTFSQNIKLRKQENQVKQTLRKIARFRKINIVENYVLQSVSQGLKSRLSLKDELDFVLINYWFVF